MEFAEFTVIVLLGVIAWNTKAGFERIENLLKK